MQVATGRYILSFFSKVERNPSDRNLLEIRETLPEIQLPYLFLLFILIPIIEIAVLIQVGSSIGLLPTLLIIIATAILGTFLLRQQGLATLTRAQQRMASGQLPAEQMMEGIMLLIGGVLLLTPGFVTDIFGFCCLIPVTRQWMARRLASRSVIGVWGGVGSSGGAPSAGSAPGMGPSPGMGNTGQPHRPGAEGDVIEGSYKREDP